MKFLGNTFDFEGADLLQISIQKSASAPSDPEEGFIYYNTIDKKYFYFDGTDWQSLNNSTPTSESNYAVTVSSWVAQGNLFYKDIIHNLNTYDLQISAYSLIEGKTVELDEIERLNLNAVRVWSTSNETLRILVIKTLINTYAVSVSVWQEDSEGYYQDIYHAFNSLDIIVNAYNATTYKNVQMDEYIRLDADTLRVRSATNTETIRILISKV